MPMSNREIIWEHFQSNYDGPKNNQDMDFDDEDDNDMDIDGPMAMPIPVSFLNQSMVDMIDYTPWGAFHKSNPLSPSNMYDLWLAHFRGFKAQSIPDFVGVMNNIDGVAVWAQHDPYCVIIGPGKAYDPNQVKRNVEDALLGPRIAPLITNLSELTLSTHTEKGVDVIGALYPDGTHQIWENPSEDELKDILELPKLITELTLFKNGKPYEHVAN